MNQSLSLLSNITLNERIFTHCVHYLVFALMLKVQNVFVNYDRADFNTHTCNAVLIMAVVDQKVYLCQLYQVLRHIQLSELVLVIDDSQL